MESRLGVFDTLNSYVQVALCELSDAVLKTVEEETAQQTHVSKFLL